MNNLFLCKTPYQIMVAIQLILTEFKADNNDIFVLPDELATIYQ